jgi:hypothetical protein
MKWPKSTLYRERYYGSEEPFLMARKGYAMALTLRAKSNPCRPADEQKTTRRLTNPFAGVIFSSRTKALIPATHNRFITPKAKRRLINAQQQIGPRQNRDSRKTKRDHRTVTLENFYQERAHGHVGFTQTGK